MLAGAAVLLTYSIWKTKTRKALWKFRMKESRFIHIVSTVEEWDEIFTLLSEKCRTFKVKFYFIGFH